MTPKARVESATARSSVALLGLLAAALGGCTQEPLCPELGDCGGPDPVGDWTLAPGYGSCMEDLFNPQTDTRLAMNDKTPALVSPPEPAVYDWCDLLIASGGTDIRYHSAAFYYESGQIGDAKLRINPDYSYTAGITRTGTFVLDLPAVCMRQFGAMDGRPIMGDPNNAVGDVCAQLQPRLLESGLGEGSYRNVFCAPNPADPQGCLCQFDVTETGGPAGFWKRDGNTLVFIPKSTFPQRVTFCNKGTSLELTGANGDYLFGVKGLRTFKMQAVTGM